jgi:hypothetical protein
MLTLDLPDTEALALDAMRHYVPEASYGVAPPQDWSSLMPFVVISKVGGKTLEPPVDHSILSVSVFAGTRKQASTVARRVQSALYQAARDGFSTADGAIAAVNTIKGPIPIRDGLSGKHADSFMFDATYNMWARSHYVA